MTPFRGGPLRPTPMVLAGGGRLAKAGRTGQPYSTLWLAPLLPYVRGGLVVGGGPPPGVVRVRPRPWSCSAPSYCERSGRWGLDQM